MNVHRSSSYPKIKCIPQTGKIALLLYLLMTTPLWAIPLGQLTPGVINQGETLEFTLFGSDFDPNMQITFSGTGVNVVGQYQIQPASMFGDGEGDRVVFQVQATATAETTLRSLTVTIPEQTPTTKFSALQVIGTSNPNNPNNPNDPNNPNSSNDPNNPNNPNDPNNPNNSNDPVDIDESDPRYQNLPPRQSGQVNIITRASPDRGELGGQVNLWIEGREFSDDVDVKFGSTGLFQAYYNDMPIPSKVVRNTDTSNGNIDGVLYFLRISPDAQLGPVSITVTSPSSGTSYTKNDIFTIVREGEGIVNQVTGSEDIDSIAGASPPVGRAGQNAAVWVWGNGFNVMSRAEYSNPAISLVRDSVPVIESQNFPGYDGMQTFLQIAPNALPGPVNVTISNPNGTSATGVGVFSIIDSSGGAGTPGGPSGGIEQQCTGVVDNNQEITSVPFVTPDTISRGMVSEIEIIGEGIACGANVIFHGGGIRTIGQPRFFTNPELPGYTTIQWQIEVATNAQLGSRAITVINPNNTSPKTNPDAFTVVNEFYNDPPSCQTPSASISLFDLLILLSLFSLVSWQRKKQA